MAILHFKCLGLRKHTHTMLAVAILLTGTSCKKESVNCGIPCTCDEVQLLQTGFNGTTLTNGEFNNATFSGTDTAYSEANIWEGLEAEANIGSVQITYEDGNDNQRLASIVDDGATGNKALKFQIMESHIAEGSQDKGRVQLDVTGNPCVRKIYKTVRIKFDEDLAYLMEWQ